MSEKIKRTLSALLAICMVMTVFSGLAVSASTEGAVTLLVNSSTENDTATREDNARYKTLSGAITAAVAGDTIKLETDVSCYSVLIDSKDLTIDFNGKMVTCTSTSYALNPYGTTKLILKDSSANNTGGVTANGTMAVCILAEGTSSVTVEGGKFSSKMGNCIQPKDKAKIIVNGGVFSSTSACAYTDTSGAHIFLNGGSFTGNINALGGSIFISPAEYKLLKTNGNRLYANIYIRFPSGETKLTEDLDTDTWKIVAIDGDDALIDLNGYNITGKGMMDAPTPGGVVAGDVETLACMFQIQPGGKMTIKNTGACDDTHGRIYNDNDKIKYTFKNFGELVLDGNLKIQTKVGSLSGKTSMASSIYLYSDAASGDATAKLTVNDGVEIHAEHLEDGYNAYAIMPVTESYSGAVSVTINGGTIYGEKSAMQMSGTLAINGGTFSNSSANTTEALYIGSPAAQIAGISNAEFISTDKGIWVGSQVSQDRDVEVKNTKINGFNGNPIRAALVNQNTSKKVIVSGKNTYWIADNIKDSKYAGVVEIIAGIYSVDPSAYVPDGDSDGVKDYAVLTLSEDPFRYLVAPWTEVGADNQVSVKYDGDADDTATAEDTVDINALNDTEGIVSDSTMVTKEQFTISSDENSFSAVEGAVVTAFNNNGKLTVQKTKSCAAEEAYVWYGGKSVGKIWLKAPSYKVDGEIISSKKPTAKLVRDGVAYSTTVSGETSPYHYISEKVPAGIYNLVVSVPGENAGDDPVTVTVLVTVVDRNVTQDVTFPEGNHNSKVTIEEPATPGAKTPNIEAGGLDAIASTIGNLEENKTKKILIELKVKENEQTTNADDVKTSITNDNKQKGVLMDLDLLKQIDDATPVNIPEVKQEEMGVGLVTVVFHLPENISGKYGYAVYRYHGTSVDKITEDVNTDGEYITVSEDATEITAHLKYFSSYAIAYNDTPTIENNTIYANGTALYIDGTGIYIDLNRDGILDSGEPVFLESTDLSEYSVYGGYKEEAFDGDTLITQTAGNVLALNGGSETGSVLGNSVITLKGGTSGTVSGGTGVTGTKTVHVSGNPVVTTGIDLSSITDEKVTINGYLTDFTGKINLLNPSATAANTVVASATESRYLVASDGLSKASQSFTVADCGLDTKNSGSSFDVVITNIDAGLIFYTAAQDNAALDESVENKKQFSGGDTITVDIYAKSTVPFHANSYQFTLNYPETLTLERISSQYQGTANQNGKTFGFSLATAADYIPVTTAGGKIATATFQVNTAPTDNAKAAITLEANAVQTPLGMGELGTLFIPAAVGDTAEITMRNIAVTLHATAYASFGAAANVTATAYAKYGQAGLYTDNTYTTPYLFPEITAADGKRLKDGDGIHLWGNLADNATVKYADNAAVNDTIFYEAAALYIQTTSTVTISFTAGANGSLSSTDSIAVDLGKTLAEVSAMENFPTVTPAPGYKFAGWKIDGAGEYLTDEYEFTADVNITAVFTDVDYTFTDGTPATVNLTTTAGVFNGIVNHSADVIFSAAPADTEADCYYVRDVSVTIGGQAYTGFSSTEADEKGNRTITIPKADITGNIVVMAAAVNYHKVEFKADIGTTAADLPKTAYASHGSSKLYTTIAKAAANTEDADFIVPNLTAAAGYRLYDAANYWNDGTAYSSTAVISNKQVNTNTIWTAKTVKTYVITPVAGNGGIISSTATITVDAGTKFKDVEMPGAEATNTGWHFAGWYKDAEKYTDDTEINSDVTLTATFLNNDFKLTTIATNATVTYTSGTSENDTKISHGTDIVFTAEANADYVITGVGYSISGVNGGATTSVPLIGDAYTISGDAITGDITVIVTAIKYHIVTFVAGTGNTMDSVTAYVQDGGSKLFSSLVTLASATNATGSDFEIPSPTASAGFRLAKDDAAEPLWSSNGDNEGEVTSANIGVTRNYTNGHTIYTSDVTYTAYAIKQYTITFEAGANGSLIGETSIQKDANTYLTSEDIPVPTPEDYYAFDKWVPEPLGAQVTEDVTYTASFKAKNYTINFQAGNVGTFTAGEGITTTEAPNGTIVYGTDASFTFSLGENYRLTAIQYTLNGVDYETLEPDESGNYTIPGNRITGNITVIVNTVETHKISFVAAGSGTVSGTQAFILDDADSTNSSAVKRLTADNLNSVTLSSDTGSAFKYWQIGDAVYSNAQLLELTYKSDTEIKAVFGLKDNEITDTDDIVIGTPDGIGNDFGGGSYPGSEYGYAHYGTDVVFKVTTDKTVSSVYYSIDNGERVKIEPTIDPVTNEVTYVIPGNKITGAIEITADVVNGTFEFILRQEYKAIVNENAGKKIAVFNTEKLTNGRKYVLRDGREFYWSERYQAYVMWVADPETADTMAAGITTAEGTAVEIALNDGDVDGDGIVTAADAGFINDCLHGQRLYGTLDIQLFKLDVCGEGTGVYQGEQSWKYASVTDIEWVIDDAVGLHTDTN